MSVELPGAAPEHINLLRQAGIQRAEDLRDVNPKTLWNQLSALNDQRRIVPDAPDQNMIESWVETAQHEEGLIRASEMAVEGPGSLEGEKQEEDPNKPEVKRFFNPNRPLGDAGSKPADEDSDDSGQKKDSGDSGQKSDKPLQK